MDADAPDHRRSAPARAVAPGGPRAWAVKPARSVDSLREAAWAALEDDPDRAVRLARQALRSSADAEGHYLLGCALLEAGDDDDGFDALRRAVALDASHVDAWAELGRAAFDRRRWDEARECLSAALRQDPHHPMALYTRACLRERRGDFAGAERDYLAAACEAPGDYSAPVDLPDELIREVTDEVLAQLHPSLQTWLDSVPILVDEVPSTDTLETVEPPAGPADLLACISGPTLRDRAGFAPWSLFPTTIVLFRRNLARIAADREELVEELRITLLHEIGHFLGLDEEDLEERGLD